MGTGSRLTTEEIAELLEIVSSNDRQLIALIKERAARGAGVDATPPALVYSDARGSIPSADEKSDEDSVIAESKHSARGLLNFRKKID
jgi:hypothetical protein